MDTSDIADESLEQRRAKRRKRLQMLRGSVDDADTGANGAAPRPAGPGGGEDGINNAARRRAFQRAYRVLTETPADGSGNIAGTPFTQAGVMRLLDTLRTRAASPEGAGGGKVASRLLQFLSPTEGEAEQVQGVSLEKLQRIARMAQNFGPGRRGRDRDRL